MRIATGSCVMVPSDEYRELREAAGFRRDVFPLIALVLLLALGMSAVASYFWWRTRTAETQLGWRKKAVIKELSQ